MRSVLKMVGAVALVAALSTSLAACASSTEASDASTVPCATVVHEISSTKTALTAAQTSLKTSKGTPGATTDQSNVTADTKKLSALNKRSVICGSASTAAKVTYTKSELQKIADSMTINQGKGTYVCATDSYKNIQFAIGSKLPAGPGDRFRPDSPSTPIAATDLVGARAELQDAICKDPLLGSAWLTFVATDVRDELLTATGLDLLVLDPRLKAYTDLSKAKSNAAKFDPLEFVPPAKRTSAMIKNAIKENAAWQQDASLVDTLLDRFMVTAFDSRPSLVNYHLSDYSLALNSFANVAVQPKQENLAEVTFTIEEKGQCGEITAFAANRLDKRPELLAAQACTPPTTTGCVVTATHKCTTTPGCVVTATHKCTTVPVCTVPTKCLTPKDPKNSVTPPQGWNQLGPDPLQTTAPAAPANPLDPNKPKGTDPGPSVPVQGATPAPVSTPAPTVSQAPAPSDPGTPVKDSDG